MAPAESPASTAVRRLHATTRHLSSPGSASSPVPASAPSPTAHTYEPTHKRTTPAHDTPNFIDNAFVPSATTKWIDLHDPASNELVTRVPQSTEAELRAAVDSAQAAFPAWRATSVLARQQIMFRYAGLIRDNMDRLAASITAEQGKTLADAKGDVLRGLQVVETSCGATLQMTGEVLEVAKDMETRTIREPLGVVAAICPFNFPAMIPLWSIPIATMTGNTIVVKPSERDPGATMILVELAQRAGFPPGVINVVHGAAPTVDFLLDEPRIKAISFVGSNRAGEYIHARASANGKRVQANLGAKNHAAVLPSADRTRALDAIVGAAFGAAGQRCMALSAIVLVGETRDWLPDLAARAALLHVDSGFEPTADVGPVISPAAKKRIEEVIASAEAEGARILLDGRGVSPPKYPRGNWIGPTVIAGVTPDMRCYREEIFGPVLVCLEAGTLDEAIALINANEYGNGTAVFTTDGREAQRFVSAVEAGQVGVNVPIPIATPPFSFSGNKKSIAGGGASTFYGRPALNFYTQVKTVTTLWRADDATSSGKPRTVIPTSN